MRLSATALLFALLAACGGDGPPAPPPPDGAPRDTGGTDAATDTASMDAGPGDAGAPDAGGMDAGAADTGARDTGTDTTLPPRIDAMPPDPRIDGGVRADCVEDDFGVIDNCACIEAPDCSGGEACADGTTCVDDGCGGRRCVLAGHPCVTDGDCPAGSSCTSTVSGTICRSVTACAGSADCPLGFACESGACVDRRVSCGLDAPCPIGFTCLLGSRDGAAFCRRVDLACATEAPCAVPTCVDVDGDGATECAPALTSCVLDGCDAPDAGTTCYDQPGRFRGPTTVYGCGDYGPCPADGCASGFECLDLWGDGRPECVPPSGACARTADCPARQVCAPPMAPGPPTCQGSFGS